MTRSPTGKMLVSGSVNRDFVVRAESAFALTSTRWRARTGVPAHDAVEQLSCHGTHVATLDMLAGFCGLTAATPPLEHCARA